MGQFESKSGFAATGHSGYSGDLTGLQILAKLGEFGLAGDKKGRARWQEVYSGRGCRAFVEQPGFGFGGNRQDGWCGDRSTFCCGEGEGGGSRG
jgi:hypothetical protein